MRTRLSILLVSLFVIACGSESSPKSAALATSVVAADFIGDWEMCDKDGFQLGEDLLYKKEEISFNEKGEGNYSTAFFSDEKCETRLLDEKKESLSGFVNGIDISPFFKEMFLGLIEGVETTFTYEVGKEIKDDTYELDVNFANKMLHLSDKIYIVGKVDKDEAQFSVYCHQEQIDAASSSDYCYKKGNSTGDTKEKRSTEIPTGETFKK